MVFRRIAVVVGAVTMAMAPATAWAQSTPAPPGEASAVGAQVEELASVAETSASADQTGGRATANALEVGGEEVVGGTQTGPGETSGSLVDTGDELSDDTGELRVAVLPHSAKVARDGSSARAVATAALLRLLLGDLLQLHVLQSSSTATHSGSTSTGSASSDAIFLRIGGGDGGGDIVSSLIGGGGNGDALEIVVLHSEASSAGQGQSYLLRIGDTRILTNDDGLDEVCSSVSIQDLVRLACVAVSGGQGSVTATVANATVGAGDGGGGGLTARLVSASARGLGAPAAAELPASDPGSGGGGGGLPVTGGDLIPAFILGVALLALGGTILAVRNRSQLRQGV